MVMKMWSNFARCGDPSVEGFEWLPYDVNERRTAVLCKEPKMQGDVLSKQRRLLMPLIRHMINASYMSLDYNVPFTRKMIGIAAGITAVVAGIAIKKLIKK